MPKLRADVDVGCRKAASPEVTELQREQAGLFDLDRGAIPAEEIRGLLTRAACNLDKDRVRILEATAPLIFIQVGISSGGSTASQSVSVPARPPCWGTTPLGCARITSLGMV